jgi:hypothetical protein
MQALGTTIGGLRFAPGYLSHAQQSTPPPTGPITGVPGQQLSSVSSGVGLTRTIGMTSSVAAPPPPTSSLVSQLPSVSHPSMPALQQQQQLPVKPLHSSTPLAQPPGGLHPQQPRPLPPYLLPATTTVVPNSVAGVVHPSPLIGGPSVRMAAPKPVGNAQGRGGPGVATTAAGQPRPPVMPPGSTAYQSPQMAGVRPPAYGYGAPPPPPSSTSVGGALGPPRTAHHAPPPPSTATDDTEVTIFLE